MRVGLWLLMLANQALQGQAPGTRLTINNYSADKEARLGEVIATDIRRRTTAVETTAVRDYVERLGSRLGAPFIRAGLAFSFTVVTDSLGGPTREPLALPGGYIFIPTELILASRDEAEFAGMLAHAIAHVADRHTILIDSGSQAAVAGTLPVMWIGNSIPGHQVLIPHGLLKSQREFELRADLLTVGMMTNAGFDPAALVHYIRRVQPANDDKADELSSLPSLTVRISGLEQAIAELPAKTYSVGEEFTSLQRDLHRLIPDTPARRAPSLRRNNSQ